jgi:hypothetical protein
MSPTDTSRSSDEAPCLLCRASADAHGNEVHLSERHYSPVAHFVESISAVFERARKYWATAERRRIEDYLSQSSDLADCERRVRELDRNGWTLS